MANVHSAALPSPIPRAVWCYSIWEVIAVALYDNSYFRAYRPTMFVPFPYVRLYICSTTFKNFTYVCSIHNICELPTVWANVCADDE